MNKATVATNDIDRYIDTLLLRYFPLPTSLELQSKTVVISYGSYMVLKGYARNRQTTIRLAAIAVIERGLIGVGHDWAEAQNDVRVLRWLIDGGPLPPGVKLAEPPPPPIYDRDLEELLSYFTPRSDSEKGVQGIRIPADTHTRLWIWAKHQELPMADALAIVLRRGMLGQIEDWELQKRSRRIAQGKALLESRSETG
jgi:hypothetical protein